METAKPPNGLLDVVLTVLLPSATLEWLSYAQWLGSAAPVWALVLASLIPLGYGVYCWVNKTGLNFFSVFGLAAIIITGALGLSKLDAFWFALKEASVPVLLGFCFPLSFLWKRPLIEALLMQPQVLNVTLVRQKVSTEPAATGFQFLLKSASWQMGGIMMLSAVINFALAIWLLEGKAPQTPEHNSALSKLNWGGMLVIGIPMLGAMMFIMLRFFRQLATLTGLEREDILNPGQTVRRRVG